MLDMYLSRAIMRLQPYILLRRYEKDELNISLTHYKTSEILKDIAQVPQIHDIPI